MFGNQLLLRNSSNVAEEGFGQVIVRAGDDVARDEFADFAGGLAARVQIGRAHV